MNPGGSQRGGIWPMAGMAMLTGLLSTFVIIQWVRSRDHAPSPSPTTTATSTPTSPTPTNTGTTTPTSTPTTTTKVTPTPPIDPRDAQIEAQIDALVDEARRAIKIKRLDLARAAVIAARKLKSNSPKVIAIDQDVRVAMEKEKEDEAKEFAIRLQKLADETIERARPLWQDNRYDAAQAILDEAVKAEPKLTDHATITTATAKIATMKNEAIAAWETKIARAREAEGAKSFGVALEWLRRAQGDLPERLETLKMIEDTKDRMREHNMVKISGGANFTLGTAGNPDEPVRRYAGPGFMMDRDEVTNEDYLAFVLAKQWRAPSSIHWRGKAINPGMEKLPVSGITAADAEAYATWVGKRLPTEDEWEYAARHEDGRTYPWGNDWMDGAAFACNCADYVRASKAYIATSVGKFPNGSTPLGVRDMSGNVAEWTSTQVPVGGVNMRVIKGGSFMMPKEMCRPAARFLDDPGLAYPEVGFRCVIDLK